MTYDSDGDVDDEDISSDEDDENDEDYASAAEEDAVEASKDDAVDPDTDAVHRNTDINVSNITETCSESITSSNTSNSRFKGVEGVLQRQDHINNVFQYHDVLTVKGGVDLNAFSVVKIKDYRRYFIFVGVIVQTKKKKNRNLIFDRIGRQLHQCYACNMHVVSGVDLSEDISGAEKALTVLLSMLKKSMDFPEKTLVPLPKNFNAVTDGDADVEEPGNILF